MADEHPSSPPRKRVKLEEASTLPVNPRMSGKEEDVGITAYVNPDLPGFAAIFKKRYTDFLVNEILPSGEVVHLISTRGPTKQRQPEPEPEPEVEAQPEAEEMATAENGQTNDTAQASAESQTQDKGLSAWQQYSDTTGNLKLTPDDEGKLQSLVGEGTSGQLLALFNKVLASPGKKARDYGNVSCPVIDDKEKRTALHQSIRTIFRGRLDSYTGDEGAVIVHAASQKNFDRGGNADRGRGANGRGKGGRGRGGAAGGQRNARPNFSELGGDYLHFTLYKENRDTMEVVSFLARELHIKPQQFQFAGTKDRRGVTAQKVSVYRIFADRLVGVSKKGRGWRLGDYEYKSHPLALGDLAGNEFTITLRDCQNHEHAAGAIEGLKRGFINYYGMQRFGTFATRTDTVGVYLLKGDFEAAVKAILKYPEACLEAAQNPEGPESAVIGQDDKARALAIHYFEQGDFNKALSTLPRKFSAENQLIRHLGKQNAGDYYGALQTIQRNLRLMYVHAYQSLIWNLAATHRWTEYGDKVMEGDLVMVNEHKEEEKTAAEPVEEVDADGEVVVQPTNEDRAITDDDRFERARALSAEEAASGKYSVYDIVLPTPGYDILYPSYMVKFFEETMAKEENGSLNPHDMRRKWRDISLSGSYRKLLSRVDNIEYQSKEYTAEDEQFVETDAEKLKKASGHNQATGSTENKDVEMKEAKDAQSEKANDEHEAEASEQKSKVAIILKFQLGSSQYATMALRELMKGGLETWKMDFSSGR